MEKQKLETTALFLLQELSALPADDAYQALIDLLSLVDDISLEQLYRIYCKKDKWKAWLGKCDTVGTGVPSILRRIGE